MAPKHPTIKGTHVEQNFLQIFGRVGHPVRFYPGKGQRPPMAILNITSQDPVTGKWNNFQTTVCYGQLATWCNEYLLPQMRVLLIGHLMLKRWMNRKTKRYQTTNQMKVRQLFLSPYWSEHMKAALMYCDEGTPVEMAMSWGDVTDDETDAALVDTTPESSRDTGDLPWEEGQTSEPQATQETKEEA